MFNGSVEAMRPLARALRETMWQVDGEPAYSVLMTEYEHRDFTLVDVTAREATKGRALAWRAEALGLTRDEVMAIGDNFNDLEMLEFAGLPVVMANAVDGLKQQGWAMTGDNENAGLAEAMRRFALNER